MSDEPTNLADRRAGMTFSLTAGDVRLVNIIHANRPPEPGPIGRKALRELLAQRRRRRFRLIVSDDLSNGG